MRQTAKDARLAAALARGESVETAAREAGFSSRTAFRRLQEPEFQALVSETRGLLVRTVAGRLAGAGEKAVETMVSLLSDPDGKLKLGAARGVLEHLFKAAELVHLAELVADMRRRIEALERHGEGDHDANGDGSEASLGEPGSAGPPAGQDRAAAEGGEPGNGACRRNRKGD